MAIDKLALFEATKSRWPATINVVENPAETYEIYRALEQIIPPDDDWQQLAAWAFYQALGKWETKAFANGEAVIFPHTLPFADFDKRMRDNLADESWVTEQAIWELEA